MKSRIIAPPAAVRSFIRAAVSLPDNILFKRKFGFSKHQLSALWIYLAGRDDMDWTAVEVGPLKLQIFNTAIMLNDGTIISVAAFYENAGSPEVYLADLANKTYVPVLKTDTWKKDFVDGEWVAVVRTMIAEKVK